MDVGLEFGSKSELQARAEARSDSKGGPCLRKRKQRTVGRMRARA